MTLQPTQEPRLGALDGLLPELQSDYAAARPRSAELFQRGLKVLPGGNSRSQLYFEPFPFYVESAEAQWLYDADGLAYIDLLNNYTSLVHGHLTDKAASAHRRASGQRRGLSAHRRKTRCCWPRR